jgi:hypothetical protein
VPARIEPAERRGAMLGKPKAADEMQVPAPFLTIEIVSPRIRRRLGATAGILSDKICRLQHWVDSAAPIALYPTIVA